MVYKNRLIIYYGGSKIVYITNMDFGCSADIKFNIVPFSHGVTKIQQAKFSFKFQTNAAADKAVPIVSADILSVRKANV